MEIHRQIKENPLKPIDKDGEPIDIHRQIKAKFIPVCRGDQQQRKALDKSGVRYLCNGDGSLLRCHFPQPSSAELSQRKCTKAEMKQKRRFKMDQT